MTVVWVGKAWPDAQEALLGHALVGVERVAQVLVVDQPAAVQPPSGWAIGVLVPPAQANPLSWLEKYRNAAPLGPVVVLLDAAHDGLGRALLRRGADDFVSAPHEQVASLVAAVTKAAARWLGRDESGWQRVLMAQANGLLTLRPDGRIRWADPRAAELLACRPAELLGRRLPVVAVPGEAHELVVTRHGRETVLEVTAGEGVLAGEPLLLVALRDVTDRRRGEQELRSVAERYRRTVEDAVVGIYQCTPEGRFVQANAAMARLCGYADSLTLSMSVRDAGSLYVEPDRRAAFMQVIAEHGSVAAFESEIRRGDGELRWISETARPIHDSDGRLLYYEGVAEDITDRKAAEREVEYRISYERLIATISADLVQRGPDDLDKGIEAALASVGEFLAVDRCFFYRFGERLGAVERCHSWQAPGVEQRVPAEQGTPPPGVEWFMQQIAARQPVVFGSAEEMEPRSAAFADWLRSQGVLSAICLPVTCGGQHFGFLGIDAVQHERAWRPDERTLLLFVVDLLAATLDRQRSDQERWRLEAQVRHAQKLESLGVLAGGIAHDFNNLLVGILGNAGLAYENLSAGSPARDFIDHVRTAAQRAAELTNQLLAYSGKGRFVNARFNLSTAVTEMTQLLEAAVSRKADLVLRLDEQLPPLEGDPSQIRQVVMNLLTNASDALEDRPGRITVTTSAIQTTKSFFVGWDTLDPPPPGRYVVLTVTDDGCGMDEDTRARIFDPFFSTKFAGRGLGLAAVQGIVRAHHGAIRVSSAPGAGTVIDVCFPAVEPRPELPPPPPKSITADFVPATVMVVDDEPTVLEVATQTLAMRGYRVLQAHGGKEALARLEQYPALVDIVLLDLTMPEMSGIEVFAELQRRRPDLPVILTSGYSEQEATRGVHSGSLAGFVQKPYQPRDLVASVQEALAMVGIGPNAEARA